MADVHRFEKRQADPLEGSQTQTSVDLDLNFKPPVDEKSLDPEDVQTLLRYLRGVIKENEDDLNFPAQLLQQASAAFKPDVSDMEIMEITAAVRAELKLAKENSPYPEVRACVEPFDDPSTPVMTFRMWTIGLFLVILGTGLNQFFAPRQPSIGLSVTFAQLVSFPLGCLFARVLPKRVFRIAGYSFTLNPGPFNMKEHMLISIMANASFGGAYATDIIAVLKIKRFYNNPTLADNLGFQMTLVLSTQLIGYTLAGMTKRFLVYPAAMVWWGNLLEIAVLKALHSVDAKNVGPINGWKLSQMRFFCICGITYGIYFILPDVFFQSLSFFNWTTWIAPENAKLAMITGTVTGLGLNPFPTLDWNFMELDPIVTPLWSIMNHYIGAIGALIGIAILYFKNTLYSAYLPINSNGVFDNMGKRYNASRVLDVDGVLDQAKYKAYSPPFIAASNIIEYTAFFAFYTSTVVHSALYYRKHIAGGFVQLKKSWKTPRIFNKIWKSGNSDHDWQTNEASRESDGDIHYQLMRAYPEVPEWWFMIIGVISIGLSIFMIEYYETQMPVWGLVFALAIAMVLLIPSGIMSAVASVSAPLNVLSELVGGYALVGRPVANMLFKTYGYITMAQALGYASDMKLAHYVKVPPRALFVGQTVATVLSALVSLAVLRWQLETIPDLCDPQQHLHFTCPGYNTFFTASVLWGVVGPHELFTKPGAVYHYCIYGFLIGAIVPFLPWALNKVWPKPGWKLIHTPVIVAGFLSYGSHNLAYITPVIPLALFFQRYLKPRYVAWYDKYALILPAGIGAGVAIFGLIYFFAFQMNGQIYSWVGNDISTNGCDGRACRLKEVPTSGFYNHSEL
ncbi:putative oligopeptide transporter [Melampsora americana]|nr:putative oligopeptide transporter [Melampsora americana]